MAETSKFSGWKDKLQKIIKLNLERSSTRDKALASSTKAKRAHFLFNFFARLRSETPYVYDDPASLKPSHVEAMIAIWKEEGCSTVTINNNLSTLRIFCHWIGKDGMLKSAAYYQEKFGLDAHNYVSNVDKSWTTNDVDPLEVAARVSAYDPYVAMQIRAAYHFGLRRKEAVRFKPWASDMGDSIHIFEGTKGGRPRILPITNPEQRALLDEMKAFVRLRGDSLSNPSLTLAQSIERTKYVMRKFGLTGSELGVTMHGLRHQYLNDRYEEIAGAPSPVRGGIIEDKEKDSLARRITTEEAGHSRLNITTSYYGTLDARKAKKIREYNPDIEYKTSAKVKRLKTQGGLATVSITGLPQAALLAMGITDDDVDITFTIRPSGELTFTG